MHTDAPATTEWTTGGLATGCPSVQPDPPPPYAQSSSDDTRVFSPGTNGFSRCLLAGCASPGSVDAGTPVVPVPTVLSTGDLAVAATDGRVLVLDPLTSAVRWTGTVGAPLSVPLAVTPTTIYAAAGDGTVTALPAAGCGAATCTALWTAALDAPVAAPPVIASGSLYVATSGSLTAFRLPAA